MNENITKKQILKIIADYIGVEQNEIEWDDSLIDDLHLNPSEIVDLAKHLEEQGIDTSGLDFSEIETISDIFEALEIE